MKSILNKLNLLVLGTVLLLTFPGCSDDNTSDLKLDGDTWLTALELNDTYTGGLSRSLERMARSEAMLLLVEFMRS